MDTRKPLLILALGLAIVFAASQTSLASRTISTEYRYGSQFDEWFVRGDADISSSSVFDKGIRLAAWDGQDERETTRVAIASLVYFFPIAPDAKSVAIEIGYKIADEAAEEGIAGILFVRDLAVERQYASFIGEGTTPLDEPGFFGDTYLLPGDEVINVVELSTTDRVVNGVLEVHISAGAGQLLDVQYVQATSLKEEAPVYIQSVPSVTYVRDPYRYTYAYYYLGPWYYPHDGYYDHFVLFDDFIHPFYWGGWVTYRASFYTYHPWVYRPHGYYHVYNFHHYPMYHHYPHTAHYRYAWYHEHYDVDIEHKTEIEINNYFRRRAVFVDADDADVFRARTREIARRVRRRSGEVRSGLGNRWAERIHQWRTDPTLARRELARWDRSGATVKEAVAKWRSVDRQRRDTGRDRIQTLKTRATEKLRTWRESEKPGIGLSERLSDQAATRPRLAQARSAQSGEAARTRPRERREGSLVARANRGNIDGQEILRGTNNWRNGDGVISRRQPSSSSRVSESRRSILSQVDNQWRRTTRNENARRPSAAQRAAPQTQSSSLFRNVPQRAERRSAILRPEVSRSVRRQTDSTPPPRQRLERAVRERRVQRFVPSESPAVKNPIRSHVLDRITTRQPQRSQERPRISARQNAPARSSSDRGVLRGRNARSNAKPVVIRRQASGSGARGGAASSERKGIVSRANRRVARASGEGIGGGRFIELIRGGE